jgi:hypothetical protein
MRLRLIGATGVVLALAVTLGGCDLFGGGGGDVDEFCDKVTELESAANPFENIDPTNIEDAQAALTQAQESLNEVADVAPDEISDDVEQVQSFFDEFVGAVQDADSPEDFAGIAAEFQGQAADLQEANQRLTEYTSEECGESIGASGASGESGSADSQ